MRRNWIKIYIDQSLRGSMFQEMEDPAERFVWFGFLLLAGDSALDGRICVTEKIGYTDPQLGAMLRVKPALIVSAKLKMQQHGKVRIHENNVIEILNWKRYQSEYYRQKGYRQKLQAKVTSEGDVTDRDRDRDRDKERKEKLKQKEKKPVFKKIRHESGLDPTLDDPKKIPDDPKEFLKIVARKKFDDPELKLKDIEEEFAELWRAYPGELRHKGPKQEAKDIYVQLRKRIPGFALIAGFDGYREMLAEKQERDNFSQRAMMVRTFLRSNRWYEWIGYLNRPRL